MDRFLEIGLLGRIHVIFVQILNIGGKINLFMGQETLRASLAAPLTGRGAVSRRTSGGYAFHHWRTIRRGTVAAGRKKLAVLAVKYFVCEVANSPVVL